MTFLIKTCFAFVILSLIILGCKSKDEHPISPKKQLSPQQIYEYSLVGFNCGESGQETESVQNISAIIKSKNHQELKHKLFSIKPSERYLATVACLNYLEHDSLTMNRQELSQIVENKNGKEIINYCVGKTDAKPYPMFLLFNEKNDLTKSVESWFKELKEAGTSKTDSL